MMNINTNQEFIYISVKETEKYSYKYSPYIEFKQGKKILFFPLKNLHIRHHKLNTDCYAALIPRSAIEKGKYEISLLLDFKINQRKMILSSIEL
ncbi:MAG: hypothetical protein IPO21_07430 [Bacteroidales bacterium]|nr:hypothetical protein [Bacteroidales bacterium]